MSVASAAKAYLVGANGVLAGVLGSGVKVSYSAPRDILRDIVYAGDATGSVELAAFAPAGARIRISENLSFPLVVRTWRPGRATSETAEAAADAIYDQIRDYVAANWLLGDIPNLKKAAVSSYALAGWTDDDGAGAVLTLTVELMSYRT